MVPVMVRKTRHFCTYFDHRYLPRGLALQASLAEHAPDHVLWVLCLSEECEQMLKTADIPAIRPIPLSALEAFDPALAACRENRSVVEYYFTCSPCLPRYVFHHHAEVDELSYLDSDLFFFTSPEPVFEELGAASVGIIAHGFAAPHATELERYGRYNVGWLSFRRTSAGMACLDWWRERCIEWCFDRVEDDRFADQKYLDQFGTRFPSVHAISHPGANLAPWNVEARAVSAADGGVLVNGMPLLFFHFQGLKQLSAGVFDANFNAYGARLTPTLRELVYRPYLRALVSANRFSATLGRSCGADDNLRSESRHVPLLKMVLDNNLRIAGAALRRNLIRL